MGFLNPKEQILEIILTQQGRDNLAKNGTLGAKYYAFSDDDIDYQLLDGTLLSVDTRDKVNQFAWSIGQNAPDLTPLTGSR